MVGDLLLGRDAGALAVRHGCGEDTVAGGLAAEGLADEHESVTCVDDLVQLEDFATEIGDVALQTHLLHDELDAGVKCGIFRRGQFDAGKEVGGDAHEELDVLREEFWQVHVADRAQHQDFLLFACKFPLQLRGRCQHGLHCTHAVVVVVL